MKSVVKKGVLIAGFCALAGYGKTAATLMKEFDAVLPSGTEARVVWIQVNGSTHELWGVDSREGVPRKIDVGTINVMHPQLTADATRVVFFDQAASLVRVVNWNGTGLTEGIETGDRIEDYWKDPGSEDEYVVMYSGGSYSRVNIATGASEVLCSGGDDGARLSPDGTRMAVYTNDGKPSVVNVSNCNSVASENCGGSCGCVINIAPDDTYRFMRQVGSHEVVKINGSGPITGNKTIISSDAGGILDVNTARNSCVDASPQYDQTRWVHPDIITFYVFNVNANPYLFNIATEAWVSIQDDIGCLAESQNVDAIVSADLPGAVDVSGNKLTGLQRRVSRLSEMNAYSLDGRLIRNSHTAHGISTGVEIRQSADGMVLKIAKSFIAGGEL